MAEQKPGDGAGTSEASGTGSDSFVMLNVKTLDSRIYSFHVEKDMPVTSFKQKIADQIGLPVAQQRLIFRGKVLKDETLLSEYHVETGDTLHLVERQLGQSQSSSGPSSGETNVNSNSQGNNASVAATQSRPGQLSHSVVLGTLNVGDFGESVVPEISRVIGAVLNSLGVNNQNAAMLGQHSAGLNASSQVPPSSESESGPANAGSQTQPGNPMQSGQLPSMLPFPLPFPGASMPLPSLDTPIPDSLNTIVEFINRMEEVLSRNGNQPGQSATDMPNQPPVQLPSNAGGLPLPEAMSIVLRRTERLLSGGATRSLSHIAGRLDQESSSTDPSLRSQVQSELVQTGLVMQHLGALFLELGRTMLTVRMGQSPAESVINAGPAVYISPLGPSPIMVQPSSLQVSPLFNIAGNPAANTGGPLGPIGMFGGAPRHVNIHIHAGATPVPIIAARTGTGGSGGAEGAQTEHTGGTGQGDAASMRGFPMRNVIATSVTTRPTAAGISSAQPVIMVSGLQPPDSQNRNAVNPRTGQQQNMSAGLDRDIDVMAGTSEADISITQVQTNLPQSTEASPSTAPNIVSESAATEQKPDVSSNVPLGLGIGGLQTTRRTRPPQTVESSGPSGAPPSSNTLAAGQQILQSLASMRSSPANNNRSPSNAPSPNPLALSCGVPSSAIDPRASAPQFDMMGMMGQVLQNPAFNNLLSNIGGQTGAGSGDMRGMLQQFTEDPESMNTINQLAQQMSGQDLPNLLGGSRGRGQPGGGIDLSGMIQQMMPLVTRALSGDNAAAGPAQAGVVQGDVSRMSARQHDSLPNERNTEINVSEVIQRIAHQSPPQDIMRTMVQNSLQLVPGRDMGELVEICEDEGLANDFMEALSHDLRCRMGDGGSQS